MTHGHFSQQTFAFLAALAANNQREWFEAHRDDYETAVRGPALAFISDMTEDLYRIAPHFLALPKNVGGSLMRIHRDVRFRKDKQPYKTNIGIHFRHELAKDVHAPGYYVHVEPGGCFVGVGLWRPEPEPLGKIRDALVDNGAAWVKARDDKAFRKAFELVGDTLANAPRGYAKDHPLVEDLKRKDFTAMVGCSDAEVMAGDFRQQVAGRFAAATPYMRFLCQALGVQF